MTGLTRNPAGNYAPAWLEAEIAGMVFGPRISIRTLGGANLQRAIDLYRRAGTVWRGSLGPIPEE